MAFSDVKLGKMAILGLPLAKIARNICFHNEYRFRDLWVENGQLINYEVT